MNIVQIEPFSPAWHAWRSGHDLPDGPRITETAAVIIAGHSRGTNIQRLWQEFTGRITPREPADDNAIQARVGRQEQLRARFAEARGLVVRPACIVSTEHRWAAATLDGLTDAMDSLCVLTLLDEGEHQLVREGQVPDRFATRIQWQLLCADRQVQRAFFFACPTEDRAIVEAVTLEISPDEEVQHDLLERARRFREAVVDNVPPAGSRFEQAAHQWLLAHRQLERATEVLEGARARLAALYPAGVDPITAGGVTVYRANRATGPGAHAQDLQSFVVKRSSDASVVLAQLDAQGVPLADLPAPAPEADHSTTSLQLGW